jgi:hypothetical protein
MLIEIFLLGVVSGCISGFMVILYLRHIQIKRLQSMAESAQNMLDQMDETIIDARIEFDKETMIMYNSETEEFLAQGSSMEELNDILKTRYPNKMFNVKQEQIDRANRFGQ